MNKKNVIIICLVLLLTWREFHNHSKYSEILEQKNTADELYKNQSKDLTTLKNKLQTNNHEEPSSLEDYKTENAFTSKTKDSRSRNPNSSKKSNSNVEFRSSFALASIERFLVLDDAQKEQVKELIEEAMSRAENNEQGISEFYNNRLREILGEESFNDLKATEQEEQIKRAEERIEQEVYTYSRKLDLNSEQEAQMSAIMTQAREDFFPNSDDFRKEMMFSGPEERQSKMLTHFQNREEMENRVQSSLQAVMTDEQYNQYLEIESSSSSNSFRRQMIDNHRKQE